jgi:hypothetical protein
MFCDDHVAIAVFNEGTTERFHAALQDWNEISFRFMVKFVHWIANIWTCTAEREIYE